MNEQTLSSESGEPPGPASEAVTHEADPVAVAREIALRRLTVRARSRQELEADLARRRVPTEAAREVLDRFEEVGLVDDAQFAQTWVTSRSQRRRASSVRLKQELRLKGVDDAEIDAALESLDPDADLANALALARTKVGSLHGLEPSAQQRRLAGFLSRRGFGSDIVRRVVRQVLAGDLDA